MAGEDGELAGGVKRPDILVAGAFDDLDRALDQKPLGLLEQMYITIEEKKLTTDQAKELIRKACGGASKMSKDMTETEIKSVLQVLKLK